MVHAMARLVVVHTLFLLLACLATCVYASRCSGSLPKLAHGIFPGSCFRSTAGTVCTAFCITGGSITVERASTQSAPKTVCLESGKWSKVMGECPKRSRDGKPGKKVRCTTKPATDIGQYGTWPETCTNLEAGQTCTAQCQSGYNRTGSPTLVCQADGTWSTAAIPAACELVPPILPPPTTAGAALPADVSIVAGTQCQAGVAPGAQTSVSFSVTAPMNPDVFRDVGVQVDFPKLLWPNVVLTCQDATAHAIPCDSPPLTQGELAQDILSRGCLLGSMGTVTAPKAYTCTLTYMVPLDATARAALADPALNNIVGSVTFAPFDQPTGFISGVPAEGVVEDSGNNSDLTCILA